MLPKDYVITRIEGEYAYLRELDSNDEDELFIALALLPQGVDIGTKLHYEMLEYTIIEG
ncbi:MAG: hypothetical protein IKZ05_03250 [Clostridia bacterium]|nr:hypothetical protein [Clostridia bacterium]